MIVAFSGATGRVDSAQIALLAAHALTATGRAATLVRVVEPEEDRAEGSDLGFPCVNLLVEDVSRTMSFLVQTIREVQTNGSHIVLDLPASCLRAEAVREIVDIPILAVGPYLTDERAAATLGAALDAVPGRSWPVPVDEEAANRRFPPVWYLGCRRPGGTATAAAFAAAMTEASHGACVRTLPVTVAAQSRAEMAAVEAGKPGTRSLRYGILLLLALEAAAADVFAARVPHPGTHVMNERERLLLTSDERSSGEKLRDLADDLDAFALGHGPTLAALADAPVLHRWARDTLPISVLTGIVGEHPNVADGRRVRTSEIIVSDNAMWARTLSRLYVLGEPAGSQSSGRLQ